jgi:hypothetical protein
MRPAGYHISPGLLRHCLHPCLYITSPPLHTLTWCFLFSVIETQIEQEEQVRRNYGMLNCKIDVRARWSSSSSFLGSPSFNPILINSFIHSLLCSLTLSFIQSIHSFIVHSFIHSVLHSLLPIHSFVHPVISWLGPKFLKSLIL